MGPLDIGIFVNAIKVLELTRSIIYHKQAFTLILRVTNLFHACGNHQTQLPYLCNVIKVPVTPSLYVVRV